MKLWLLKLTWKIWAKNYTSYLSKANKAKVKMFEIEAMIREEQLKQ